MVQFVYPDYELPDEYKELIDSVDHSDIVERDFRADVTVINGVDALRSADVPEDATTLLRASVKEFIDNAEILPDYSNITVVLTDVQHLNGGTLDLYRETLTKLADKVAFRVCSGKPSILNVVTDRMRLHEMNNCNAGVETITIAPDGKFYICPAFYIDGDESVGDVKSGLSIPNIQLYKSEYAPICRRCDAYNCRRCVWLNKKFTHEINTPGREQCIMAHHERNASRLLLEKLRNAGVVGVASSIPEIDYLDPFEKITR